MICYLVTDRDEVNRREVSECEGWVWDLVIGVPSRLRLIRKVAVLRVDFHILTWDEESIPSGGGGTLESTVVSLDGKTGLVTGLLTGIQDWKCPVALSQTSYGSKSLKVILMDSNFGGHPVLNPLVTLWASPTSRRTFFEGKKFIF